MCISELTPLESLNSQTRCEQVKFLTVRKFLSFRVNRRRIRQHDLFPGSYRTDVPALQAGLTFWPQIQAVGLGCTMTRLWRSENSTGPRPSTGSGSAQRTLQRGASPSPCSSTPESRLPQRAEGSEAAPRWLECGSKEGRLPGARGVGSPTGGWKPPLLQRTSGGVSSERHRAKRAGSELCRVHQKTSNPHGKCHVIRDTFPEPFFPS